jgi:hypothetical protein
MEDLDTLRLLAKLVPEYCGGHTEEAVRQRMFEVVFAIDEVLALGFKEQVTIQQVKTFTEMDSHEEKLQKIIMEVRSYCLTFPSALRKSFHYLMICWCENDPNRVK